MRKGGLLLLKTLAKSIREYKLASILSPLFVSFEVILECLMPFVISMLVEVIESSTPTMAEIWKYAGILVAIAVASLVTGTLAGAFCARASTGFAKNLRKDLYYHIQDFSFENIDKFSTPSLVTRMTTDVTNVQLSYMMIVRLAIRAPLMVIFSFVMAFVMGGDLAWIFLAVVPLVAFALFAIMYKVMPTFRRLFHKYDDMNESIQENVSGIRVVKAYVREEYEKQKFGKTSTALMKDFTKAERLLAWNDPIMQFAFYGVLSAVLFVGSYLIMSVGEPMYNVARVSQLIVYGMQILSSVMMFSMVFAMIAMSGESARRIVEILVEKSTLHDPENPVYEVKYRL